MKNIIESKWLLIILVVSLITVATVYFLARLEKPAEIESLSKEVNNCLSLEANAKLSCVNKEMEKISKEYGVKIALDIIEPLSQEHPYLLDWSHEFAHTIGGASVANYRYQNQSLEAQIGKSLTECDGYGAFGCYHGVIEVGLSILPIDERASVIRNACLKNPLIQDKQYFVNQCLHWFGHGVAIFSNFTLEQALAMCEGLNENFSSDEVQLCLSGLFHSGTTPGNSDTALLHNVANVWKKDDPYFPCLNIEEKFRGHCFSHTPGRTFSEDPKVIFSVCDNIPETNRIKKLDYIHRCYETASNIILPQVLRDAGIADDQKAKKIVADCNNFSQPEYRKFCYAGAARYWVLRDPLLNNLNPFRICKLVDKESKAMCYSNIGFGNNENYYSEEKLNEYCANSEPEYINDCISHNPKQYLND